MAVRPLPGSADNIVECAGNGQSIEGLLASDDLCDEIQAHRVQFLAGALDLVLDFREFEAIGGIVDPIGLAIHLMKTKPDGMGFLTPIRTCRHGQALHVTRPRRGGRQSRLGLPIASSH